MQPIELRLDTLSSFQLAMFGLELLRSSDTKKSCEIPLVVDHSLGLCLSAILIPDNCQFWGYTYLLSTIFWLLYLLYPIVRFFGIFLGVITICYGKTDYYTLSNFLGMKTHSVSREILSASFSRENGGFTKNKRGGEQTMMGIWYMYESSFRVISEFNGINQPKWGLLGTQTKKVKLTNMQW